MLLQELMLEKLLLEDWSLLRGGDDVTADLFEGSLDLILRQSLLGEEGPLGLLGAVSHFIILQEPHRCGDLQAGTVVLER